MSNLSKNTANILIQKHKNIRTHPGAPPGTLHIDPKAPKPVIRTFTYGPKDFKEVQVDDIATIRPLLEKWPVVWINVDGLGDAEIISALGDLFHVHRLALEDVVNVHQRAKVEEYGEQLFIVARMITMNSRLETEQISLFVGKGFVVTFQEHPGDCLEPVRERIRSGKGRIRNAEADYLAYALLDAIVDGYFPILEAFGDRMDALESEVIEHPDQSTMLAIRDIKRDLLTLRRSVWPLRDAVNQLLRDSSSVFHEDTHVYLRDCYDHVIQVIDMIETHREMAGSLMDVYMSSISNRMNEIMKVLTIFAAIFIPLTFIAGIYGMNFSPEASAWNMPELNTRYGYPVAILAMVSLGVGMLAYFRAKGWLGSKRPRRDGP